LYDAAGLRANTLDDLMRLAIERLISTGACLSASKGPMRELTGVLVELTNPRARLSRTETRGKPFSCLGQLCWYLARVNDVGFISYYLPKHKEDAEDGSLFGGYGPRLFDWNGVNQVSEVTSLLRERPTSRRAVIQVYDRGDIIGGHKDVACTCTLQFMIRDGRLHMLVAMRSNDIFLGLPHDFFCFTMLQEIVANDLGVELGSYKHVVGSLHLYDKDTDQAREFLAEGFQSTKSPMPEMPRGDPWPSVKILLEAESAFRSQPVPPSFRYERLHEYWADLVRLLEVYRYWKEDDARGMESVLRGISSPIYRAFIEKKISDLGGRNSLLQGGGPLTL